MDSNETIDKIRQKALALGFCECGFAKVRMLVEEQAHLERWLLEGNHGEMEYMARNFYKRLDPRLMVENAKTMIVVLQNYFTQKKQTDACAPVLSKYAFGADYHLVMKKKLFRLLEFIQKEISPCTGSAFVDSAPVLERAWARIAGLGWTGRNSNLISPLHGSFFFIGELVIDIDLQINAATSIFDRCGKCRRCVDACPTQAILPNRTIDAEKCISYQTIEHKGDIDEARQGKFENRVFGCDICQDVCPWNRRAQSHNEPQFEPQRQLMVMTKKEWQEMDEEQFNRLFGNSSVKRTGFERLKRNLKFIAGDAITR